MIEQGAANEALDGDRLRLSSEAADEAGVEIGASADAVSVGVIGVGESEDGVFFQLGYQTDSEERNRVALPD